MDIPFINSLLDKNVCVLYVCTEVPKNAIVHERLIYIETGFRWFTHLLIKNPHHIKALFHNNVISAKNRAKLFSTHFKSPIPVIESAADLPVLKQISNSITKQKIFLIETFDGLGDILLSLPTAETLHSLGWKVQYLVHKNLKESLNNLPFINKVYTPQDEVPMHLIASYVSLSGKLSKYNLQVNQQHRIYSTAEHCGVTKDMLVSDVPKIILTKDEEAYAKKILKNTKNVVCIAGQAVSQARAYPKQYVQNLCILLSKNGFNPLVVGAERVEVTNCLNITGMTTVRQLMALVNKSDYVVSVDTGVLHIAGAFNKKTVAIFGPIKAKYRCSTYKNCVPIEPDIPCIGCMDGQWVPKEKRLCAHESGYCMKMVTPSIVLSKLQEIGNSKTGNDKKRELYLEGYAGIGDNFWQRPFMKELCKDKIVYLMTYTPQVYWDIPNLRPVRAPYKSFKHHNKLADKVDSTQWYDKPKYVTLIERPDYWVGFKKDLSISDQFRRSMPIHNYDFSFPIKQEWIEAAHKILHKVGASNKKVCIVHFPTQRTEWTCAARDPEPRYMQMLIDKYKDDYFFISIADTSFESFTEEPRNIDYEFHKGELSLEDIFGLVKVADMVISPNCFLLPMSIAIGTKTFGVYGGCQKPELFLDDAMDLSKYSQVTPEPFCNCLNPSHECNKKIPKKTVLAKFEELKNRGSHKVVTTEKQNLLIYKVGTMYHGNFLSNEHLLKRYNIIFENSQLLNLEGFIKRKKIGALISVDYPGDSAKEICNRLGVNWLFNEAFLGIKNVFDRTGAHFDPDNDIKKYVDLVDISGKLNKPTWTKVKQPENITKKQLFHKYGLKKNKKYIVLLGQEVCDKSIIHSKNKDVKNYEEYIYNLTRNNLDTTFLFKPHPVYKTIKKHDAHLVDFVYNYKNIITIDESIDSLFDIFDVFTAYSSTTVFEGLLKNRKFATAGYHFCDNDDIVYQLKTLDNYKDLYNKLRKFKINEKTRNRYMYFICNYYSIFCNSQQLVDRLELSSEEYFNRRY